TEPTTMLTDYLLAFFILVLSGRLFKRNESDRQRSIQFWNFAFIATALGAIMGGTSHGFALYLNAFFQAFIWKATIYAIGFASFFMLSGTVIASVKNPARRWLLLLATVQLAVYCIWMLTHEDFKYVIYDYVPAMLIVVALQIFAYWQTKSKSAKWIISGIIVSFAAAGIQQSGFTLHQHFNHNDLYHVIQMGGMYLFYRGVSLLEDQ
ncbi:hypothetical protein MJD09_00945, partial [bacterium]|nr:hypothetical protein [bacterium]